VTKPQKKKIVPNTKISRNNAGRKDGMYVCSQLRLAVEDSQQSVWRMFTAIGLTLKVNVREAYFISFGMIYEAMKPEPFPSKIK